jgi:hypothetical protein
LRDGKLSKNQKVDTPLTSEERRQKLAAYFTQQNDFRFFVGVPLDEPIEWDEVFSMEGDQLCGADLRAYAIGDVTAWFVCYAGTLEMVDAEGLFAPLPEGVTEIQKTEAAMPLFTQRDLDAGLRLVRIEFAESPTHPGDPKYYQTTLVNCTGTKIRCVAFGAYVRVKGGFQLGNVTGGLYSAEQFEDWYGVRRGGWIEPRESVNDATNYGGPCYWVYFFETESGLKFHAGKEVKGPGFWARFKEAWKKG